MVSDGSMRRERLSKCEQKLTRPRMANMKMATVLRNCIVTAVKSRSWDNMFDYDERRLNVTSRESGDLTMVTEAGWVMCVCV